MEIKTPSQLDALPAGSVVLDADGYAYQKGYNAMPYRDGNEWWASGQDSDGYPIAFPALLLHIGNWAERVQ